MRISRLHLAFIDYQAAVQFFHQVLGWISTESSDTLTQFEADGIQIAIHPDWGQGDTAMTLALKSEDCARDLDHVLKRGAQLRSSTKRKFRSINADICGPGKLVIEFEQMLD